MDISERYSLYSEGGKKKGLFLVGRENCVDTFGLFLLGGKSQPTSSIGGKGGAIKWGLIKFTENQNNKHFFGSVSLLNVTSTSTTGQKFRLVNAILLSFSIHLPGLHL